MGSDTGTHYNIEVKLPTLNVYAVPVLHKSGEMLQWIILANDYEEVKDLVRNSKDVLLVHEELAPIDLQVPGRVFAQTLPSSNEPYYSL